MRRKQKPLFFSGWSGQRGKSFHRCCLLNKVFFFAKNGMSVCVSGFAFDHRPLEVPGRELTALVEEEEEEEEEEGH